jgi:hypothetical protein
MQIAAGPQTESQRAPMKFLIVLTLVFLACVGGAFAASEQSYITARDRYLARFKPYAGELTDSIRADEERALQDLAGKLRRALGPTSVKGFSGKGQLNLRTLFPDSDDSDAIDGLVIPSDDGRAQLLLTTRTLVASWLRLHRDMLVDNALEMGSKDPIKKVLFASPSKSHSARIEAWLARHREVAQDFAGTITSEPFYAQIFNFGAAVMKYADVAVTKPTKATSTYAALIGRQQDIGPYPPQEIIVTIAQGPRVYVLSAKPEVAIEMIPACDAIWQAVLKERDEAYETQWAAKAKDGTLADKPVEIENAGDRAFHRCFAEKRRPRDSIRPCAGRRKDWWTGSKGSRSADAVHARAFSGKVDTGFRSKNAITAKMPERFLFLVSMKPL